MTLAATQQEINAGQDTTVIALAKAATPVVQEHLQHLQQIAGAHGAPTNVPGGIGRSETGLGGALIGTGLLAAAAAVLLWRRRASVEA